MPRFQTAHAKENYKLLSVLQQISKELDCTLAQVSLAWLLQQGKHILPIPGTTNINHLQENMDALKVTLTAQHVTTLNTVFSPENISGSRYPAVTQQEIDTEEYC
jgi:aryl-alcohol dehydrogenase-like predicted oxidoreductase